MELIQLTNNNTWCLLDGELQFSGTNASLLVNVQPSMASIIIIYSKQSISASLSMWWQLTASSKPTLTCNLKLKITHCKHIRLSYSPDGMRDTNQSQSLMNFICFHVFICTSVQINHSLLPPFYPDYYFLTTKHRLLASGNRLHSRSFALFHMLCFRPCDSCPLGFTLLATAGLVWLGRPPVTITTHSGKNWTKYLLISLLNI